MADLHPIPDHMRRALLYVDLITRGGGGLTVGDLDEFAIRQPPRPGRVIPFTATMAETMADVFSEYREGAKVSSYMYEVGWITVDAGEVRLTRLGQSLARALDASEAVESASDGAEILSPEDPLIYASLTRAMSEAGAGMLVDPYFDPDLLDWLVKATSINRVLIKAAAEKKRTLFGFYLGAICGDGDAPVEVRITADKSLHDRCVVHEDGSVSLIGASLNGVHKNFTAIVPLPSEPARAWREEVEHLWRDAEPIEAVRTIKGAPAQVDDASGEGDADPS